MTIATEELQYALTSLRYQLTHGLRTTPAKVLVNGSPKSGTTWMLKMIASIPGYRDIGNFNGDIQRYHTVQPGDVVHGHDWYTPELKQILEQNNIRVILMIRDPRDQLVSRMFHVRRSAKHAWHERMKEMSIDEALMLCIEGREGLPGMDKMIQLAQTWIDGDAEMLCVRYEELLADPVTHFQQVIHYLGISGNPDLAQVVVRRNRFERLSMGKRFWKKARKPGEENANSHFRKGIAGDWRNYLKPEHIARFKEVAGEQLIALGYERDLNW